MFKHIIKLLTALALIIGVFAFVAPAANASSNDFEFEVTSISQGKDTVSTSVTNTQLATLNGATQVLWQDSNYNPKLTPRDVKKAWPKRFKVTATGANSSQVIYKKAKRKLVILKSGSKVRNTGRHNQRRVGFVWTTTRPTILKYDKKSRQYRHAADLLTKSQLTKLQKTVKDKRQYKVMGKVTLSGKKYYIVVWCGNYIGGKVTIIRHVVWVRFADQLVMESQAESVAKAGVTFNFKVTCPSSGATFDVQGFALAEGRASDKISYTQRTRAAAIGSLEYQAKQKISINQKTEADARASVKISGTCGSKQEEHQNPIGEIFVGEHAVDQGGTMPVFGRVAAFDGAVPTLGSPKVTPADLGGIYNWGTVSTERDGVTPCATGWVCYQGYFRLEKAGTPGTEVRGSMVATAKDNKNGSFTTEPLEFKAAYKIHPET